MDNAQRIQELHNAAGWGGSGGDEATLETLLQSGVSVNATDEDGNVIFALVSVDC